MRENDRSPSRDVGPARGSPRQRNRDADDEQEERKDEVGGRPPIPLGVIEGPVDVRPVARVVDDDHRGDRQAAKHVERDQARCGNAGQRGHRRVCGRYRRAAPIDSRRVGNRTILRDAHSDLRERCCTDSIIAGTVRQPFDGVLVIAFGGPNGPADIRPFLANVLRGRRVAPERVEEVAHHYELFGGVSPLTMLTMRQAEGLRQRLCGCRCDAARARRNA